MPELAAAPPAATSAASWKRDEPELHTLPSGNVALLQKPNTTEMMKRGEIPNPLIGVAVAAATGQGLAADADYAEVAKFMDFMVAAAFVEPLISIEDEPGEGELHISALSDSDRNYVLIWVQRGVAGLRRFRLDATDAPTGGDGGDLRDPAE